VGKSAFWGLSETVLYGIVSYGDGWGALTLGRELRYIDSNNQLSDACKADVRATLSLLDNLNL
jgi:hypothetical protein